MIILKYEVLKRTQLKTSSSHNYGNNHFMLNDFELVQYQFIVMIFSKGFLSQLRPKRLPYWLIFPTPIFMNSTQSGKEDWQDLQQRSIIAYHMMKGICQLKDIDHANLFSKHHIRARIQKQANQLKTKKLIASNWELKEENIDKVCEGFDPKRGCLVDLNIWCQNRFTVAAFFGRICLMPSFVTGEIFYQLISIYIDGITKKKFVISGQKGTGKSFAYLIYDYLSQFIIAYRMSADYLQRPESQKIWLFVQKKQFDNVKKLLYIPLRQVPNISSAIDHLLIQTKIKKIKDLQKLDKFQRLSQLADNFKNQYKVKYGIQLLYIVDEANSYYSCFRQMVKSQDLPKSDLILQNDKKLSENSALLARLNSISPDILVFNSSRIIEAKLIESWNKSGKSPKYFCIYQHEKSEYENCFIKYSVAFQNSLGHVNIYQILWQNMWKYFSIATNQKYRQKENIMKKFYSKSFKLSYDKQIQQKKQIIQFENSENVIKWKLNVQHLNIRTFCQKKQNIRKLFLQILENESSQQIYLRNFLRIKQQIQTQAYISIRERFLKFYNKSIIHSSHSIRFQIICLLNSSAYNQMMNQNNNIQSSLQNYHFLQSKNDEKYFVDIDFHEMFLKINKIYIYSMQSIQIIHKVLLNFNQEVGLGYKKIHDPLKFRFFINPVLLWKITLLLDQQFIDDSSQQFRLLIKGFKAAHYTGNHLNCLYFRLFKQYQIDLIQKRQFTLILDRWQLGKNNKIYYQDSYLIAGAIGFQFRHYVSLKNLVNKQSLIDWRIQLADVFLKAKESQYYGKYIVGFCKKKDLINEDSFAPKNPIFDYVLVKFYSQDNQDKFQATFIDSTCGNIDGKIITMLQRQRDIRRLVSELKQMEALKDIKIQNISSKFLILGTETKVKKFISTPLNYSQKKFYLQPLQENEQGTIKINFGVRAANYFVRGRHIKLSQDKLNFENLMFSTMKEIVFQLQSKKSQYQQNVQATK